jgi:uncharacterized protein (DUF427 family)
VSLRDRLLHRVVVRPADVRVRVSIGGTPVADSRRALVVSETGLPDRFYVPAADVRIELLEASGRRTFCPYKGMASYWSATAGGRFVTNAAWSYTRPRRRRRALAGHFAFREPDAVVVVGEEPVTRGAQASRGS